MSIRPPVCLSVCLFVCLSVPLSVCLSALIKDCRLQVVFICCLCCVIVVDFFNRINLIYGTISEYCSEESCPVMSGGPKYVLSNPQLSSDLEITNHIHAFTDMNTSGLMGRLTRSQRGCQLLWCVCLCV